MRSAYRVDAYRQASRMADHARWFREMADSDSMRVLGFATGAIDDYLSTSRYLGDVSVLSLSISIT